MPTIKQFAPPEIRSLATLSEGSLPQGPLYIQLEKKTWQKMERGIAISRRPVRKGAKGLLVVPDLFGGIQLVPICVSGSKEGLACIPILQRTVGGGITFAGGCRCIGGKDPVDNPPVSSGDPQGTCTLQLGPSGISCAGNCGHSIPIRQCRLVKSKVGGRFFITCQCQ